MKKRNQKSNSKIDLKVLGIILIALFAVSLYVYTSYVYNGEFTGKIPIKIGVKGTCCKLIPIDSSNDDIYVKDVDENKCNELFSVHNSYFSSNQYFANGCPGNPVLSCEASNNIYMDGDLACDESPSSTNYGKIFNCNNGNVEIFNSCTSCVNNRQCLNPDITFNLCSDGTGVGCTECEPQCDYVNECSNTGFDSSCVPPQDQICIRNTEGNSCNSGLGTCSNEICCSSGKVLLMHMDEGIKVIDSSVNNNYGLPQNGVDITTAGKLGGAGNFDGVNDYIDIVNNPSLDLTSAATLTAWIKTSSSTQQYIVSKYYPQNNLRQYEMHVNPDGSVACNFWQTDTIISNTNSNNGIGGDYSDGNWHQVTCTIDTLGDGLVRLYIDGNLAVTATTPITSIQSENILVRIGRLSGSTSYWFKGLIDEVAISNRAATPEEVSALYNSGSGISIPSNDPSIVSVWHMDEPSWAIGNVVYDESSSNNNGINNGAQYANNGLFNTGLYFDGSDHVNINDAPSLSPSEITISLWFYKLFSSTQRHGLISKWNSGVSDGWFIEQWSPENKLRIYTIGLSTVDWQPIISFSANTWYNIVFTYDGSMKKVYVNGIEVASQASTGSLPINNKPIRLGVSYGSGGVANYLKQGYMDEAAIWNRALTSSEVLEQYQRDKPLCI